MGLLKLLLFPVTGPAKGFGFILEQIQEQADAMLLDEGRIQSELMALSARHSMGEISEEEYLEQEAALLEWLNTIRADQEQSTLLEDPENGSDYGEDGTT
ncbi:MAG: gas vesicle protein GvpG [Chloroflexota bacterium]|nr:gas vesicle protein GvpG [Chloroflexota bacterium]